MDDTDLFRSRLETTIASLRYWVPDISDTARVEESDGYGIWRLKVRPNLDSACPFTLELSNNGQYGLTIAKDTFSERPVETLDMFLPIAEAIADGRVLQRRWSSPYTGVETHVETIIMLANGTTWQALRPLPGAGSIRNPADSICRDRCFLPYRRR